MASGGCWSRELGAHWSWRAEGRGGGGAERQREAVAERDFDFPVVLLDIDDTVPKFKSAVETNGAGELDRGYV